MVNMKYNNWLNLGPFYLERGRLGVLDPKLLPANCDEYDFEYIKDFLNKKGAGNVGCQSTYMFLKQEQNVQLLHYNGAPIDIELPTAVELKVSNTEPGIKGDTVTGGSKPAELETGMKLSVPLFINTDDLIKVDTRDGKYLERVRKA